MHRAVFGQMGRRHPWVCLFTSVNFFGKTAVPSNRYARVDNLLTPGNRAMAGLWTEVYG